MLTTTAELIAALLFLGLLGASETESLPPEEDIESPWECTLCRFDYDTNKKVRAPCIGKCGHTVCASCRIGLVPTKGTCHVCRCPYAFETQVINYQFQAAIAHRPVNGAGKCSYCNGTDGYLYSRLDHGISNGYLRVDENNEHVSINFSGRVEASEEEREALAQNAKKTKENAICSNCLLMVLGEKNPQNNLVPIVYLQREAGAMAEFRIYFKEYSERMASLRGVLAAVNTSLETYISTQPVLYKEHQDQILTKLMDFDVEIKELQDSVNGLNQQIEEGFRPIGWRTKEDVELQCSFIASHRSKYESILSRIDLVERQYLNIMLFYVSCKIPISDDLIELFPCTAPIKANAKIFDFTKPAPPTPKDVCITITSRLPMISKGANLKIGIFNLKKETYREVGYVAKRLIWQTAVKRGRTIYFIGGIYKGEFTRRVSTYDLDTHKYNKESSQLKTARALAAVICYEDKLYVVGGHISKVNWTSTVEIFDFSSGEWSDGKPICHARAGAVLVEIGGNLILLGGYCDGKLVPEIELFNTTANEWSVYDVMKECFAGFSAVAVGKRVYIAGGCTGGGGNCEVRSWSPLTLNWRKLASLNAPRKQMTLACFNNSNKHPVIYAIRGYDENWNALKNFEKLDLWEPNDAKWIKCKCL